MSVDPTFLVTGRDMRNTWRTEEEDFIQESLHYAQRNMTLLEYLASILHSGHEIEIHTIKRTTQGFLVHLGKNYFSFKSTRQPNFIQSFALTTQGVASFEIKVLEKSSHAQSQQITRQDKTFRSLLDDLSFRNSKVEIETQLGNVYCGKYELLADCIAITRSDSSDCELSLIQSGTTVVPLSEIVSILYAR
ncbi:MAG TPA: hypothetical protein PKB15_06915 [Acidimicrobiia bacterium]|nr:hypothetical protein [Acidimicrobiia bacterium]